MNRQERVHEARAKIAGGVERITGLTAQTNNKHGHHEAEGEGLEHVIEVKGELHTAANDWLEVHARVEGAEDQHKRANHL